VEGAIPRLETAKILERIKLVAKKTQEMQSRIFCSDRYAIRSNPSGLGRLVTHLLLSTSKLRGMSIKYL
jgi:hypothetical protein